MKRQSSIVFILCIKLLVALAVQSASATNQITKLKIGKFFLECDGECTELYKFRDQGFLRFGTDKQIITNDDRTSIFTYHIINDFPENKIPHFCIDGGPDLKIGKTIYSYKKETNTFSFFNNKPTAIGVYTSRWGATGWGTSTVHIFDTETGEYYSEKSSACTYPLFIRNKDGSVQYQIKSETANFFGPPNFSPVYLDVPISVKDLKGKSHPNILSLHYQKKFMDVGFEDSFFSNREIEVLAKMFTQWDLQDRYPQRWAIELDQGQIELLRRFIIVVGIDILQKGYYPLSQQFKRNDYTTLLLKRAARQISYDFPVSDFELQEDFHHRYKLDFLKEVNINLDAFMDPLYRAPYEEICKLATYEKNNQKFWNFDSYKNLAAVQVAKESNISCGTKLFLNEFDFEHICDKATTTDGSWTKDGVLQEFVKEAKNKKLNCKIIEQMF